MGTRGLSLDGAWLLAVDPENTGRSGEWWRGPAAGAKAARVPGIIQEVFPGYHGAAWYWNEFVGPTNPYPSGVSLLHFGAVDYLAEVWLNGVYVGSHEGGETPFELDVTAALRPGANRLAVRVLNPTNESIDGFILAETPHRNKSVPPVVGGGYNYGGIIESVELRLAPPVRLVDLFVQPDLNTGRVLVRAFIRNAGIAPTDVRLWCGVTPWRGDMVLADTETVRSIPPGDSVLELETYVSRHRPWDIADPVQYRAVVRLTVKDEEFWDDRPANFGFRDFRVVNGFFRLNDRRLFLKSTHTGNHCPFGQIVPPPGAPDLLRQDLIYAKASGFNMVRFISGMAHPWQLDLCDEIGLMVYEESLAGWLLQDSPQMSKRFNQSVREMVLRDRNHPSVTIWGLLNETHDGPVFRQAVGSLGMVRELDPTRLVLLSSGRWDNDFQIGSVSNPGSAGWERVWGAESEEYASPFSWGMAGYVVGAGDAHLYPAVPHSPETERLIRTLGENSRPVFLSEYGIGSLMNVIGEARGYEQHGVPPDADDFLFMRSMADQFVADWDRFGMAGVYPFPEDMLLHSQQLHCRQRTLGFDLIRSNPQIAGFNVTGMLDHAMTGEGLWTFWREWKPGIADALRDGWAPLRWCLFASPIHAYSGRPVKLEAVLSNEDVLPLGEYPVSLRVSGPEGLVWQRETVATIPASSPGADGPFAVNVFAEDVILNGSEGDYVFSVDLQRGGSRAGGRLRLHLSDPATLPDIEQEMALWGIDPAVNHWLEAHGARTHPFSPAQTAKLIVVGDLSAIETTPKEWSTLWNAVDRGATALFLSPAAFRCGDDRATRLPSVARGEFSEFNDWLYHKECVAKRHPIFRGQAGPGIMDWGYYGPVISPTLFQPERTPQDVIVAAFALGYPCPGGYASGLMMCSYRLGEGTLLINTLHLLENVGQHPAADRILLNLIGDLAPGR